ncbi:MAG: RNase adapter RapZ [Clostridia bacterium]|nr:RNase adapter RapZ [Candidatus Pelethousia sp.]NCB30506.1 RNase adapter RapZ [Clostridia bacterium]
MMRMLIVTGLSGAGKSQALRHFEDIGYFCVDNLPCEMLDGFAALCERTRPPVEQVAVVIDSRESIFDHNTCSILDRLDAMSMGYEIIFLECRDEVLERRYNETRRPHPLDVNVRAGIEIERELLGELRDRADYIIDTSYMNPMELKQRMEQVANVQKKSFFLEIMSFGYKRGVPFEADIVLDMRFSPNPYYEPGLRGLSGKDEAVRKYVLSDEDVVSLLDQVENTLLRLIPRYVEQDKRRLMVAIGCTGGRHRSVCVAEELYRRMQGRYHTSLRHRDIDTEADSIRERMG